MSAEAFNNQPSLPTHSWHRTPALSENQNLRKRNWLSSASKHKPTQGGKTMSEPKKGSRPHITKPTNLSPYLHTSPTPAVASLPVSVPNSQPKPATISASPTDKPLPSLPVATVVSGSPINRRSLIDATEKPLHRVLSPQLGSDQENSWPALSPTRPYPNDNKTKKPTNVKPSIGESVIEGIRHLHIDDGEREEGKDNDLPTGLNASVAENVMTTPADNNSAALSSPVNTQPLRTIRRKGLPPVRQTRTSELRLQRSAEANIATSRLAQAAQSTQAANHSPGPVRSRNKRVHATTPRGSPYMVSRRSSPDSSRELVPAAGSKRQLSTSATSSVDIDERPKKTEVISVKSVDRLRPGNERQTSIPVPTRLIRNWAEKDFKSELTPPDSEDDERTSNIKATTPEDETTNFDTSKLASSPTSAKFSHHSKDQAVDTGQDSTLYSFSELMMTSPPQANELDRSSEGSEQSVRGYDAQGGFKIKKLRGREGATLRISDSAHRLLSENFETGAEIKSPPRRTSIADMRRSSLLKDHLRRSSQIIKNQIELTRSFTERSLAKFSTDTANYAVQTEDDPAQPSSSTYTAASAKSSRTDLRAVKSWNDVENIHVKDKSSLAATHANAEQGDWPLKDFQSLSSTNSMSSAAHVTKTSNWVPPVNWAVKQPGEDANVKATLDAPYKMPAFGSSPAHDQNNADHGFAAGVDLSTKLKQVRPSPPFPPRISSRQSAGHSHCKTDVRDLFSEQQNHHSRVTDFRQNDQSRTTVVLSQPSHRKRVSETLQTLEKKFNDVHADGQKTASTPTVKKRMSTVRGLFHKKSGANQHGSFRARLKRFGGDFKTPATPIATNSPGSIIRKSVPAHARATGFQREESKDAPPRTTNSPAFDISTLEQGEIRTATEAALRLLDLAHDEPPGVKQSQLVELGKATVEIINAARDAEKAFEQAKQAAARAEMRAWDCKKTLAEVGSMMEKFLEDSGLNQS